jgi:flavin reductase (DIM6/NTAB) family NADH-FMN oxidoreductase RutF
MTFDATTFRQTMRLWATGVTIVAAQHEGIMRGITVSSFTSVTLDPPLILVCIQKPTEAAQAIRASGCFSVSMLGEGQEAISNLFAGFGPELPEGANYFDDLDVIFAESGSPILAAAMGWLDCSVHATHDGSTHDIFIGRVLEASGQGDEVKRPLLYYNTEYRQLG